MGSHSTARKEYSNCVTSAYMYKMMNSEHLCVYAGGSYRLGRATLNPTWKEKGGTRTTVARKKKVQQQQQQQQQQLADR